MSTCNQLDLDTLGSQLITFKNLPGHYYLISRKVEAPVTNHLRDFVLSLEKYKVVQVFSM